MEYACIQRKKLTEKIVLELLLKIMKIRILPFGGPIRQDWTIYGC